MATSELAEAMSMLLDPRPPDPFQGIDFEQPSLLDQLAEAVESSGGRGGAVRNRQSAPASLDVLGLLNTIDREVAVGLRGAGYRGRFDVGRVVLVKLWVGRAGQWRTTAPDYLARSVIEARSWVHRAESILTRDQHTVEPWAVPCPQCGQRTALVYSDHYGDEVRHTSLYLDTAQMIVCCRCCNAQWGTSMWGWLTRMLNDRSSA